MMNLFLILKVSIKTQNILKKLPKSDARLEFIIQSLGAIDDSIKSKRCSLGMYHGAPIAILKKLIKKWAVKRVICNEDYEPYATQRDESIKLFLAEHGISFETYKDQGILPEALCNYLLRLGWSHGDDEIISMEQAIEWFSLERIGRSPARFDPQKLLALKIWETSFFHSPCSASNNISAGVF